jgi:tyrosine-protein phosphatase SIW14
MKTIKQFAYSAFYVLLAFICTLCDCGCSPTVYVHGIPNLAQVRNGLWRSGQPSTSADWEYLKSLGINYVVKLNFESEGSDNGAVAAGMTVHYLGIEPSGGNGIFADIKHTFELPDERMLLKAETVIQAGGGVLVHCTHGQDRTGTVIGRSRVVDDHWLKSQAYTEMLNNNFHPSLRGLQEAWESFNP